MKHAPFAAAQPKTAAVSESFRLKSILAPIDFSARAMCAFRYAARLAAQIGGKVIILHVVEGPLVYSAYSPAEEEKLAYEAQHKLDRACQHEAGKLEEIETMVRLAVESVPEEIVLAAREIEADLIVLPANPSGGFRHNFFPSTIDKIERHAPCPVLMVPVPASAEEKAGDFQRYSA
jgi:nucleotide-binding universal stress UspA family protein